MTLPIRTDAIHLRANGGRFLLVCRALGLSGNWTDIPDEVTCPKCRSVVDDAEDAMVR